MHNNTNTIQKKGKSSVELSLCERIGLRRGATRALAEVLYRQADKCTSTVHLSAPFFDFNLPGKIKSEKPVFPDPSESKKPILKKPYLDKKAKTYMTPLRPTSKVFSGRDVGGYCGQFGKVGECKNHHRYLKVLFCGREWCKNCREIMHKRRIARWLPKAMTMESFGYFVFTVPMEMREFYQDKKHLSELRTYLRRRMKKVYPGIKALCRWHWFGDNPYVYHPHLNLMVASFEKLPKKELENIKQDYQSALEGSTGILLDKKVDVYYHYYSLEGFKKQYTEKHKSLTDEQAQELYNKVLWHKLKYITRATFTVYNKELAKKLKGYRNNSVWGKFRELTYEEVEGMAKKKEAHCKVTEELILLESGHCPVCGSAIRWYKELFPGSLFFYGEGVGSGYYSLPKVRGSPVKLPNRERLRDAVNALPRRRIFSVI